MATEMRGNRVSVEEDAEQWQVTFAESEFNPRHYVILRRDRAPGSQDMALGLDGYQVEVDHQNQSFYGGIESFVLFRDHVVVVFNAEAASVLGDGAGIVVRFSLRARQLDQLRACLIRIFEGEGCFLDKSA